MEYFYHLIHVSNLENFGVEYSISDINGKEYQTGFLYSDEIQINSLSKGVYFLNIKNPKDWQFIKFIKN